MAYTPWICLLLWSVFLKGLLHFAYNEFFGFFFFFFFVFVFVFFFLVVFFIVFLRFSFSFSPPFLSLFLSVYFPFLGAFISYFCFGLAYSLRQAGLLRKDKVQVDFQNSIFQVFFGI